MAETVALEYWEAVRRGGTLVSVKTDDSKAMIVDSILARHNPVDPVREGAECRKTGWSQFDLDTPPFMPEGIEVERIRRVN
jgi:hypothetical protein